MFVLPLLALAIASSEPESLKPGDHTRTLTVGGQKRSYLVHLPKNYDAQKPTPVVLALHGAGMNGSMMVWFSGLNKKSDEAGFIVAYPSGTGAGPFLVWNAGGFGEGKGRVDDVAYLGNVLDDLASVAKVDPKRVYACGMSNGAMMCYRLAAEMSDRIAAVAPVAGAVAIAESAPKRPVPVLHIHGTKDTFVPYEMPKRKSGPLMRMKSVDDSVALWVKLNGCDASPKTETLSKEGDEMAVRRKIWSGGKDGSEVVLVVVDGGGHTWPGQQSPVGFIGKSAMNVSANDLIWEFFSRHKLK